MKKFIEMPHEVHESTCYVNGLFDIFKWNGAEYSYFLLPIIGGMASFAYLKFKMAQPPCMVYWGNSPKYLMEQLQEVIGFSQVISEGKSFKNEFPKIKEFLNENVPVVVGALDMFYLHYYTDLYQKEHIPIHYLLVVGYDDDRQLVYVHDCTYHGIQEIPYHEFEDCLNVSTPGLSKKNTYRMFTLPQKMPLELEIAEKGFAGKAQRMLKPPVSMFGIPAMRKLAGEITGWTDESCLRHMVAYAGLTPPLIAGDLSNNDGLRFQESDLFREMGGKYGRENWMEASRLFRQSGESIIELCKSALGNKLDACSESLKQIADLEEKAYQLLL
jgi:hypothetical protein